MKIGAICHFESSSEGSKITQTENLGLYKEWMGLREKHTKLK